MRSLFSKKKYILPALGGFALAATVLLGMVVMKDFVMHDSSSQKTSPDILSDPRYQANPEVLVHAATASMKKATHEAETANKLRDEAHDASAKASILEQELRRVEAKEATRDKIAVIQAEKAKAAELKAQEKEAAHQSARMIRENLFAEARAKRAAFLRCVLCCLGVDLHVFTWAHTHTHIIFEYIDSMR
jgi:hypothetical protein